MEIHTKKELRDVLNHERKRWKLPIINNWFGWLKTDMLLLLHPGSPYLFMYCLRHVEYYKNRFLGGKLLYYFYWYRLRKLQNITGIDMYPGVAEKGVKINHGKCVISRSAHLGMDCEILSDVTLGGIGGKRDYLGAPQLGNRVLVCSGAKIIGPVHIVDGVVIGANSVVVKDINEVGTYVGAPVRKISDKGSEEYIR